jgi:RNA polymerase sigma factor (sigma-70 family)
MPIFTAHPELLRRFRAGERLAMETVYAAYVDKVAAIIRHGCRPAPGGAGVSRLAVPPADAADLVQQTFMRAFALQARVAFDGLREYGPYLYTIARRTLVDWVRKRGREPMTETMEPAELAALAALAETPPEGDGGDVDPETMRVVRAFVDGLDPELRAIHQARFEGGLSQRQASESLGITRQALRTLEGRLLKEFRRAIKRGGVASV